MDSLGSLFYFSHAQVLTFFLVLLRVSGLVLFVPLFSDKVLPFSVKILFALSLSVCAYQYYPSQDKFVESIWILIAFEFCVGVLLGFVCKGLFDGLLIGANFVGTMMGFSAASQFDPHFDTHNDWVAQLQLTLVMLLFLHLDGHLFLLKVFIQTFEVIQLDTFLKKTLNLNFCISLFQMLFQFAWVWSAPFILLSLVVNAVLGIVAKAIPAMNLLPLSIALCSCFGFLLMIELYPDWSPRLEQHWHEIFTILGAK